MKELVIRKRRITQDEQLRIGPGQFFGGILVATAGGASTVNVYDGTGTDGIPIDAFSAAASAVDRDIRDRGEQLITDLYIDLGSNVNFFIIRFLTPEDVKAQEENPQHLAMERA